MEQVQMKTPGNVPAPQLDTIQVLSNGDVFFRVDLGTAGTAGTFKLFCR